MITTKRGDTGYTDIYQKRVKKDDSVIELLGTIDECIAYIVLIHSINPIQELKQIVNDLSDIAASVAGYKSIDLFQVERITFLESKKSIDLKEFQYPFDDTIRAHYNVARTIVRRLERLFIRYSNDFSQSSNIIAYLNRLSDYLFLYTI